MTLVWCLVSYMLFAQMAPPPAAPATGGSGIGAVSADPRDLSNRAPCFARFSVDQTEDRGIYRLAVLPRDLFDVGVATRDVEGRIPSAGFARFDADALARKK